MISMQKFLNNNKKTSPYHPQANGAIKSFNKTLHKGLTKICGVDEDD
jgi:hypothetical protein